MRKPAFAKEINKGADQLLISSGKHVRVFTPPQTPLLYNFGLKEYTFFSYFLLKM